MKPGVATTYQRASERSGRGWQHSVIPRGGVVRRCRNHLDSGRPVALGSLLAHGHRAGIARHTRREHTLANGLQSRYGLGLITKPWRGLRLIHHAGTFPGVTAQFLTIREEELDVVVLFNRPAPAVDLSQKIVAILLEGRLEEPPPAPAAAPYESLLGQYVAPDTGVAVRLWPTSRGNWL